MGGFFLRSVARTTFFLFLFLILAGLAIPIGCSNDSDYKSLTLGLLRCKTTVLKTGSC